MSYSEILKIVPIAKSTLQKWLTLSGLTLTKEHLEIQLKKRIENKRVATESAKITRDIRINREINSFVKSCRGFLSEPLFVAGIVAYEAEGAKTGSKFSNSDYRLIKVFINFLNKYVSPVQELALGYRVYIHETRATDLGRIKKYWAEKLFVSESEIKQSWKKNIVKKRRMNPDYFGQLEITIRSKLIGRKLLRLSDIIMESYCGVV